MGRRIRIKLAEETGDVGTRGHRTVPFELGHPFGGNCLSPTWAVHSPLLLPSPWRLGVHAPNRSDPERLAAVELTGRDGSYSERFSRVHKGLVDLGYVPVLPRKLKPTSVRAYIAYHLPGGRRVYEVNSSTAYLARNEFKERIVSERPDSVHVSGQNVSISFDSDAQVDLILDIARGELER